MGIFSKLKNIFSSDITFSPESVTGLVSPVKTKNGVIKLDGKVTVPDDFSFALGHNGKALDCFSCGEHYLSISTLPVCCKKLKINKLDKNGKIKKKFKADAYFINLSPFELDFTTLDKAELGQLSSGIFKVGLKCRITLKVINVPSLMDGLLSEYAYLKPKESERLIKVIISDYVVSILNKYNFALFEFVNSNEAIVSTIKEELSKKLEKKGLELVEISDVIYQLPKKFQKEYEENLEKLKQMNQPMQVENKSEETEEYIPFGDIEIESSQGIDHKSEDEQFVDLDLNHLYNDKKE